MESTGTSPAARVSTEPEVRTDHRALDAYATGHTLIANDLVGGLLERLHVQYADDHQIGEALRGVVDALLEVAIDHQEPRDGVVGYLLPAQAPSHSWRYLCRTCVPAEARQIENRVYGESEIAAHGTCAHCGQSLHATTAAPAAA